MSQLPSKRIIRDAKVEGVIFCRPQDAESSPLEEKEDVKAALLQKLYSKGKTKEMEMALIEADHSGYQRGLKDGHQQGYDVGKSEGLEIGLKLGMESARTEIKSSLESLQTISNAFFLNQETMFIQSKPELIKFCLAICENLIGKVLTDPKALSSHIENLLDKSKEILKDSTINIFLSPEDLIMLKNNLKSFDDNKEELTKLNFISDHSIGRGNCKIETSLGLLNFDLKRLLDDIEKKSLEFSPHN